MTHEPDTQADAAPSLSPAVDALFADGLSPSDAAHAFEALAPADRTRFLDEAVARTAVSLLETLADEVIGKKTRKAVKRALHRLSSQGVSVNTHAGTRTRRALPAVLPDDTPSGAFSSLIDGAGRRLLWVLAPTAARGDRRMYLAQILLSDIEGIVGAERTETTRSRARKLLKALRSKHEMSMAPCPPAYLAVQVEAADALARSKGIALPDAYLAMRGWLPKAEGPEAEQNLPDVDVPEERREALVRRSAELLDAPEFAGWQPDARTVAYCQERLQEVDASTLYINDAQKAQQYAKVIDDTARSLTADEIGARYHARLSEMARLLHVLGSDDLAQLAAATAAAIPADDVIPFFLEMVRRSCGPTSSHAASEPPSGQSSSETVEAEPGSPLIIPG